MDLDLRKVKTLVFFLLMAVLPPGDEGDCGLGPIHTGKSDPHWQSGACPQHDNDMYADRFGQSDKGPLEITSDFILQVGETGIVGAVAAATALPYIVLGGFGGLLIMGGRHLFKKLNED